MQKSWIFSGAALLCGVLGVGAVADKVVPKPAQKASAQPEAGTKATPVLIDRGIAGPPVSEAQSADEEAIRLTDVAFVKAYGEGNASSVAAHFTADAEYVDELGDVFQGRKAIEESLSAFFADNPGVRLELSIDSIRFLCAGVAVEDGTATIIRNEDEPGIGSLYTTVHVKTDGKWLAASVRDRAPTNRRLHHVQLQQLNWLAGNWIDEGDDSIVRFTCQAVDRGNFLLRTFTIQVAGQDAMSGTQRIGWDPLTGKLRAWIFDSEGAYGEGVWHSDGNTWTLKTTGVTADGQTASSTSIYSFVNDHTMTWQSVDHEIAGVQQPDSEIVTIVRQAPKPLSETVSDSE